MANRMLTKEELLQLDLESFTPPAGYPLLKGKKYLVPVKPSRLKMGMVLYLSGLQKAFDSRYMALAVVPGWLCLCDETGLREYVPFDQIRRLRVEDVSGETRPILDPDGQVVHKRMRKGTKAVAVEISRDDQFTDELLLGTFRARHARQWVREISRARDLYLRGEGAAGDLQD